MATIKRIGVIGAGQMGSGIAHVFGLHGYDVRIFDIDPGQPAKSIERIGRNLDRQIARGKITGDQKASALGHISISGSIDTMADCDLVIEAATENEEIKRSIYKGVIPHLKPEAFLASNTSSISITRLAATTDRPDQFIGMHFMNPVPMMQLVETHPRHRHQRRNLQARSATSPIGLGKTPAVSPRISRPSSSTASCCR